MCCVSLSYSQPIQREIAGHTKVRIIKFGTGNLIETIRLCPVKDTKFIACYTFNLNIVNYRQSTLN